MNGSTFNYTANEEALIKARAAYNKARQAVLKLRRNDYSDEAVKVVEAAVAAERAFKAAQEAVNKERGY